MSLDIVVADWLIGTGVAIGSSQQTDRFQPGGQDGAAENGPQGAARGETPSPSPPSGPSGSPSDRPASAAVSGAKSSKVPGTLSLERRLRCLQADAWRTLTSPRLLQQWFSPSALHLVKIQAFDLRIGGQYRIAMTDPDGKVYLLAGGFLEVVPGRRLVMSWAGRGQDPSTLVFELAPSAGGTRLTLRQQGVELDRVDEQREFWAGTLRRMPSHAQ